MGDWGNGREAGLRKGSGRKKEAEIIVEATKAARKRNTCRVVHFSIQRDHLHSIVEAKDRDALAHQPDPFSSSTYLDGWSDYKRQYDPPETGSYVWPPGWKLGVGWRKHYGSFALRYVPG